MKTNNFTLKFLLISFFSLQTLVTFSQISQLSPIDFSNIIDIEPYYEEVYLYVSDNTNSLTIREKSDFKFSFNRKIKSIANDGISRYTPLDVDINNFNLGYSPLPYLYGTANLLLVRERSGADYYDSKMMQADIGIGGYYLKEFKSIFKKENIFNKNPAIMMQQKGLLVNALLGYSRGGISHDLSWRQGLSKFRLNKFYGQVGFDYQARFWGFAGTAKVGVINYGVTYLEGHAPQEFKRPIDLLKEKNNFNFSELNFRVYVGIKYGQLYISAVNSKVNTDLETFAISDYYSIGAVLDLQEIFKKRKIDEKD